MSLVFVSFKVFMPTQDTLVGVSSPRTSTLLQNRSWGEGTGQIHSCFDESSTAPNKTRARTLVTAKISYEVFSSLHDACNLITRGGNGPSWAVVQHCSQMLPSTVPGDSQLTAPMCQTCTSPCSHSAHHVP